MLPLGTVALTLFSFSHYQRFCRTQVWEKMYERMQEVGRSIHGVKKQISTWAKGKVLWKYSSDVSTTSVWLMLQWISNLVLMAEFIHVYCTPVVLLDLSDTALVWDYR